MARLTSSCARQCQSGRGPGSVHARMIASSGGRWSYAARPLGVLGVLMCSSFQCADRGAGVVLEASEAGLETVEPSACPVVPVGAVQFPHGLDPRLGFPSPFAVDDDGAATDVGLCFQAGDTVLGPVECFPGRVSAHLGGHDGEDSGG